MNYLNFNPNPYTFNQTLLIDPFGSPYYMINGIPTYYLSDGTPYYKDSYGNPFSYDQYGDIYYYDENWNTYYIDQKGNKFYYDELGNVIYFPNKFSPDKSSSEIIEEEIASNKEIEINNNDNKIKKILSDKELFQLFNIKNEDENIILPFLSDHSIAWYKVKENIDLKKQTISIISWNLLNRCNQVLKDTYNNPWKKIETQNNHRYRFEAQCTKILNLINSIENLSVILLQEASYLYQWSEIGNNFLSNLKTNQWGMIKSEVNKPPYNVTLYNQKKINLKSSFTKEFTKYSCILMSHFQCLQTKNDFSVGNVHFNPNYDSDDLYKWLLKKEANFLNIYGGDVNRRGEIFIGAENFPNHINLNLKMNRLTNLFFSIPGESSITVKEMPACYFKKISEMSLSDLITYRLSSAYYLINLGRFFKNNGNSLRFKRRKRKLKIEVRDKNEYIKIISQKIDLKFMPYGKLFIVYNKVLKKYEFRIYDDNKAQPFLKRIEPLKPDYTMRSNRLGKLYTFYMFKKEMNKVCEKFLDPDEYSLLFDIPDGYNTTIKKDFFSPFIPYSKREKKSRKTQVLL